MPDACNLINFLEDASDGADAASSNVNIIICYIILFVLLVLSGFFSASETAFTSFSIVRMKNIAKTKKRAKLALKLRNEYDRLISTILIGNNIVNIAGTSLATILCIALKGNEAICTIIVTVVILIFGEIIPKSFSKITSEKFAMVACYPLVVLYYIFYPFTLLFDLIATGMKKLFHADQTPTMTEEEFEILVDDIHEEGILNGIEKNLILNTIEYGDLLVEDIMTKNKDVVFAKNTDTLDDIQDKFEKYNYSRLPISKTNKPQQMYGIIYQKEFYEMLLNEEKDLKSVIVDPLITKPNIKISRLLKTFQKEHQHMALVKTNNKVIGLITMEDIIEELVGEIEDEYDVERDEQAELEDELEAEEKRLKEQELDKIQEDGKALKEG